MLNTQPVQFVYRKFRMALPGTWILLRVVMARYRILGEKRHHTLTRDNMNQLLVDMDYSVKSKVYLKYMEHRLDMSRGVKKPFPELLSASMGDPQSFGQAPITFLRQLLALCLYPSLNDDSMFPTDVRQRATQLLAEFPNGNISSRIDPQGLRIVRQHVSEYIGARDDVDSSPDDVYLQDSGKSVDSLLNLVNDQRAGKPVGILIPVPTYPMYSGVIDKHGMAMVRYYLNEDLDWEPDMGELESVINDARRVCRPKGIVIINPGNPTGQVMTLKTIENVIKICHDNELFILADEVYQNNLHDPTKEFYSFKHVKHRLGAPYCDVELVSMHSISKGFTGECGLRGGYMEFDGFREDVKAAFLKALRLNGSANATGQIAVDVLVKPPDDCDPSAELFQRERDTILTRMTHKAKVFVDQLNAIDRICVKPLQAGIFAYANILDVPDKAIDKAKKQGIDPSLLWALELLDYAGIAVTPGSSFLQKPGTYHFRVTIVPPIEVIDKVVAGIQRFQDHFLNTYK